MLTSTVAVVFHITEFQVMTASNLIYLSTFRRLPISSARAVQKVTKLLQDLCLTVSIINFDLNVSDHIPLMSYYLQKVIIFLFVGKVYVHCHQGISRSTTVVIAYLMLHEKMGALEALQHILKSRVVMPNDGFLKRLAVLEHNLQN